jgi:cytochrome c peroxidase
MMNRFTSYLGLAAALLSYGCNTADPPAPTDANVAVKDSVARTGEPLAPLPRTLGELDAAKVELGKMLFFDPRLSKSGFLSCNSCHNLASGGVDNMPSSIGHGWQLGPINSPTVLNAKYNLAQFWDGRAKDLKEQAGGPVANPGEMAFTHEAATGTLKTIPGYVEMFQKVYSDTVSMEHVQDAIAAFEETLITPDSRFDRWLYGDDTAMSEAELAGYQLFKEKGCASCHNGIAVGGASYQKMGLKKPYRDETTLGRFNVTKNEADKFVFKVPVLRNIELTYPYFHDGSIWDLKEAVLTMADIQLGLPVSDAEADQIVLFLKTLTGKQPEVVLPALPPSTPETPKPDRGL